MVSVLAVALVVASAMVATGSASPAVAFQQSGHWVFNRADRAIVHVDGGTHQVDARVAVPNSAADTLFTVQGQKQGFLVGRQSITTFGKSTLTVEGTQPAAGPEVPVGIEVLGGPYLVYKQSGVLVRLGEPPVTVRAGGAVDRPTFTDDGTIWVRRPDTGAVCALRRGAESLDCSESTSPGLPGALTVASASATFLDTADDAAQVVDGRGPDTTTPVGVDLPDTSLIGDRDTRGRLPSVVRGANRLVLADSSGIPTGLPGGTAIFCELGAGDFSAPVAADGIVAVVEQIHNRLLTFAIDGRALGAVDLPPGSGPASISRGGDGRIYVDDANGAATHVVGADGAVTSVTTGARIDTVVSAPAPELVRAQSPTPRLPTLQPAPSVNGDEPVRVPVDVGPSKAPEVQPVQNPPETPTGVAATLGANGAVTVTWAGGVQADTTFIVRATGGSEATQTSTRSPAVVTGLAPGSTYRFGVTAQNTAGRSGESVLSPPITIPIPPPGAPTGLTLTRDGAEGNAGLTAWLNFVWTQPNLNGGQLVKYLIRAIDRNGDPGERMTAETTVPEGQIVNGYTCLAPYRIEVRAVTRAAGSQTDITGPAATVTTKAHDCTIAMSISAVAASATSVSVTMQKTKGQAYVYWPCSLELNGTTKWTGRCADGSVTVPVTGLAPATTFSIVLRVQQQTTTVSNTVTVTTPTG
ncbi:hypothetical protein [Pseudonocardia sp. GCM10023141]|uniref:hypothetical protein n=1 Tax=Pseudonocardia sp. GCM10023141 TaxID=3252653 RepID=UPI0036077C93